MDPAGHKDSCLELVDYPLCLVPVDVAFSCQVGIVSYLHIYKDVRVHQQKKMVFNMEEARGKSWTEGNMEKSLACYFGHHPVTYMVTCLTLVQPY